VSSVLQAEARNGLQDLNTYLKFQLRAEKIKDDLLSFLIEQKRLGKKVAAYGAAAKGNTLLNYAGVKPDLVEFVCDAAQAKQGKFMPGSHIPILHPSEMLNRTFDCVLVLPWNIASEVVQQNAELKTKGIRFVTAVPELAVI
jgi:C-methyltransferase C-terminal domain